MNSLNWFPIILSAIIPLITGFIWYNEKVFGKVWMRESGVTPEMGKSANMGVVFGTSLLLSVLLAGALVTIVIHQAHIFSLFAGAEDSAQLKDPNSALSAYLADFMAKNGAKFRTFKHGALHGFIASLFFVLPVFGINALFERKSFKYVAVNVGYWMVTLMLMGGVICQFA